MRESSPQPSIPWPKACSVAKYELTEVKDFNVTCLSSLGQIDQSPFKKVGVSLRNEGEIFHVNTLRRKMNWVSES